MAPIDAVWLESWCARVFGAAGLTEADAVLAGAVLVRANLRGVDTHGVSRLPVYVDYLRRGEMRARPAMMVTECAGALVVDADGALGQVAGPYGVDLAVERAGWQAVVAVVMRGVGHLGALGVLALRAAERGMVAVVMQNGPPVMGLAGSRRAAIGNNPLAFAAPYGGVPLVFDMAASQVAFGRVIDAARTGSAIPAGWALDAGGEPTSDAAAALSGMLLPAGLHKGIGLAMLVECLAGSLSGVAQPPLAPGRTLPAAFGAFLLVVNPVLLAPGFAAHMGGWLATYAGSGEGARYPGERAAEIEAARRAGGLELPAAVVAELTRMGAALGTPFAPA